MISCEIWKETFGYSAKESPEKILFPVFLAFFDCFGAGVFFVAWPSRSSHCLVVLLTIFTVQENSNTIEGFYAIFEKYFKISKHTTEKILFVFTSGLPNLELTHFCWISTPVHFLQKQDRLLVKIRFLLSVDSTTWNIMDPYIVAKPSLAVGCGIWFTTWKDALWWYLPFTVSARLLNVY